MPAESIFDVPAAPDNYNLEGKLLMVHDLNAPENQSTLTIPAERLSASAIETELPLSFDEKEVYDNGHYALVPTVVKRDGVLYAMFQNQNDHIAPSPDYGYIKSLDGGNTWSERIVIGSGNNLNHSFGLTKSGRLVYVVTVGGGNPFKTFRTGPGNEEWEECQELEAPDSDWWVPFGRIKQMPSGRLIANAYRYNPGLEMAGLISSTDDGETWSYYRDIDTNLDEVGIEIIEGTTDEDTVLMAIARVSNNVNGKNKLYVSEDGGGSFEYIGEVPFTKDIEYGFPAEIYKDTDEQTLTLCFGTRYTQNRCVSVWQFPIADFQTIANWGTEKTFYRANANEKGFANDWGYPSIYKWRSELYAMFYDVSPSGLAAAPTLYARLLCMRITNRYEGLFQRASVGTFPEENVFSKVGLGPILDSADIAFDDGVNTFVFIPEDGVYTAKVSTNYSRSNLAGTYRKVGLALLDPGYPIDPATLFPKNPINNQPAPEAVHYLEAIVRPVVDSEEMMKFEFSVTFEARKGFELMLYGRHDSPGVAINLNNSRLWLKKIG
ncbi:exo-alpha-sialidase [Nostoc ellipsosporum NOK]|nr:exo-alpha-sialidase [Nostoc ellipsosporum NOK]